MCIIDKNFNIGLSLLEIIIMLSFIGFFPVSVHLRRYLSYRHIGSGKNILHLFLYNMTWSKVLNV